jgi:DNA-binding transcriptional LysR family regulator
LIGQLATYPPSAGRPNLGIWHEVNDLSRFKQLVALADAASFRRAAIALGISHSALSQTVAKLEAQLGTSLIVKKYRAVELTQAGHLLVDAARAMIRNLELAEQGIQAIAIGRVGGRMTIGADPLVSRAELQLHIIQILREYPDVRIGFCHTRWSEMERSLTSGEIDVFVGPKPDKTDAALLCAPILCPPARILYTQNNPLCMPGGAPSASLSLVGPRLTEAMRESILNQVEPRWLTGWLAAATYTVVEDSSLIAPIVHSSGCLGITYAESLENLPEMTELGRAEPSMFEPPLVVACLDRNGESQPISRFWALAAQTRR